MEEEDVQKTINSVSFKNHVKQDHHDGRDIFLSEH